MKKGSLPFLRFLFRLILPFPFCPILSHVSPPDLFQDPANPLPGCVRVVGRVHRQQLHNTPPGGARNLGNQAGLTSCDVMCRCGDIIFTPTSAYTSVKVPPRSMQKRKSRDACLPTTGKKRGVRGSLVAGDGFEYNVWEPHVIHAQAVCVKHVATKKFIISCFMFHVSCFVFRV